MNQHSNLTIICCCRSMPPPIQVAEYQMACSQLIVVCSTEREVPASPKVLMMPWKKESGKAAALNSALQKATGTHILWTEENETLPEIPPLEKETFYPAQISNIEAETPALNWQIRLFPNPRSNTPLFRGFEIPEIYSALSNSGKTLSDHPLQIDRRGTLFPVKDIQREVDNGGNSAMHEFWSGILASGNQQFTSAVRCFKGISNKDGLTPWNRLAVLNSLANALMENHELQEAKKAAEESLAITPHQRTPHLTLYQYYHLKRESEKAYQQLRQYQKAAENETKANWDVFLPKAHVAFLMAEISFHQGWHEQAYKHYEQFFACNEGQVSRPVLERLFLYAAELQQREKAIRYFKALFGHSFSGQHNDSRPSGQMMEALSLMTDNGWYDFASDIYRQLVSHRPEDESLRHGLIRTLVRSNQIEKAQTLL